MLAGADPDRLADRRHAMPGNIERRDVAPAVHRGRQETESREVLDAGNARAAGGGPHNDSVLGGQGGDAQLQGDGAAVVGDRQFLDVVGSEGRQSGREIEQAEPEVCATEINPAVIGGSFRTWFC